MYKNFILYKNKFLAISLIAIFAMSIAMAFAPTASAQIRFTAPRTTAAYISVAPTLSGVGQQLTVNAWVLPCPQNAAMGSYYQGFTGITVTFTRPDGTKDTFTPTDGLGIYAAGVVDPLGTTYFLYAPNMAGNWSVTMSMPAQNFTDVTGTVLYTACTSAPAYFTVQTAAVNAGLLNGWPYSPLPNANVYWSYPISTNNREWATISGDWLQCSGRNLTPAILNLGGKWQMYGSGPSTGHILWDSRTYNGGLVGGVMGSLSYEQSGTGNPANEFPVIMEGNVYINQYTNPTPQMPYGVNKFECFSLTTGQLLYTAPGLFTAAIDLPGNEYAQSSTSTSNQAGGAVALTSFGNVMNPYLFGAVANTTYSGHIIAGTGAEPTTIWNYYDPLTGVLMKTIGNVTATDYEFIDGSQLAFGVTALQPDPTTDIYTQNYAWEWNISRVVNNDWYTGLVWRTTVNNPSAKIPGPGDGSDRFSITMAIDMSTLVYGGGPGGNLVEGFNANTGKSIWNLTLSDSSQTICIQLFNTNDFLVCVPTFATYSCYSDLTGALLWASTSSGTYPWNTKPTSNFANDNNNVYIMNPEGTITALSLATGKVLWNSAPIPSTEEVTNSLGYWGIDNPVIAGGNIYAYAGYSPFYEINPIPRFAAMICINATTGATTFVLNGGVEPLAEADGYLMGVGFFDGNVYCIGKGQTSTSVSAPITAVTEGTTVLVQGNVLDQSPAQPGTPAVSDASISEQMDYLHMQNATLLNSPPKEQGVPVTLTAVDPNNNTVTIGTTTTDSKGSFYIDWKPTTTGDYKITATFAGSGSYWPSNAETGAVVTSAPTTTSGTSVVTTSSGVSDTALYTGIAAVIVVIIIVGIAIILMLQRKRP